MSVVYIFSLILMLTSIILVKKSKEKIEIIKTVVILFTLLLPYNTFVSYIFNLVNIPITLLTLTLVNLIIGILVLVKIIKDKEIQKYYISKTNVIVLMLFIIITTTVIVINFDSLTNIRYVSMDAREHYKAAREFSENTALGNKQVENNTTGGLMPMGYVNAGILFKVFNPYIGTVQLYKLFVLFEAFVYLLTGLMFYMTISKYATKMNNKIIGIIFSIIYILGYPLNAWISGFHYLVIGILLVETIIYMLMKTGEFNLEYELIIMFLLNYGLILSYALFCPFVYLAEFIFYVYKYIRDKEKDKKENSKKDYKNKMKLLLLVLVTLILPGLIGVAYLIIPSLGKVGGYIAQEGWLYKNLWSNFIWFVPFTLYAIIKSIKNREFTFDNILFVLLVIYMTVLFIGTKLEKCSEYYFYKNYFVMWLMLIYFNIKGINNFLKQKNSKILTNIYTIVYLLILIISVFSKKVYVMYEPNDDLNTTMEIFTFNKTMICERNVEFVKKEEIDLLTQMENVLDRNWKKEDKILFVTDGTQERWIQSFTGFKNILYDNKEYAIENLKEENYKYVITFENRNTYKTLKEYINKDNMQLLYENEIGKIYEKI